MNELQIRSSKYFQFEKKYILVINIKKAKYWLQCVEKPNQIKILNKENCIMINKKVDNYQNL